MKRTKTEKYHLISQKRRNKNYLLFGKCLKCVCFLLLFFLPSLWEGSGMGYCFACSVCKGGASQEKSDAYILTTVILGMLPLLLGTLFYIFIRRAYKINDEFQHPSNI